MLEELQGYRAELQVQTADEESTFLVGLKGDRRTKTEPWSPSARSRLQIDAILRIVTKDWERDIGLRRWHGIDAVSLDTSRKEIVPKIKPG